MSDALIRWIAGALAVLALLAGVWWHGWHTRDLQAERAVQDRALADARQALADFRTESNRLNSIAGDIQQRVDQINTNATRHTTEYRTYAMQNPLPADCRFDAERLRRIQSAVDDANATIAAGQSGDAGVTD
ncbi:hypothetical protein DAI18_18075 [Microvirgula aerodenitrificans]|uniref:DUF2570 domain-containing protein n=1 Tax=Microvirgula aerodenitrificans TaxID=57480 RepID=A0A2S0PED0_9NEIS|nr:hypothetical protein [Microvirgula aerodenitrificans]AVY95738.1 hypothetical protein DAI18_18075 [Microvirgula aerodenitrificans]